MKNAFIIAGILLTFFTDGNALSCVTCYSTQELRCSGMAAACPAGSDACVSKNLNTIMSGVNITQFTRFCGIASKTCGKIETTTADMYSELSTQACCKTDDCDAGAIDTPQISTVENGVTCGACFLSSTKVCKAEKTIKCTGIETSCFLLVKKNKDKADFTSLRGCASPDFCTSETPEKATKTCNVTEKTTRADATHPKHCFFILVITILLHLYPSILLWQCQDSL